MNKFFRPALAAIVLGVALITVTASCNKEFDQPPVYVAPTITANTTIKQLKALLTAPGTVAQITTDAIIRGIVIGDDKSGNLYKSLVIQDATGGILIRMEGTNLFTSYPIGQEVFVKCKGLYLGDYNKLIQLGGGVDNSGTTPSATTIPSALFSQYIVIGSAGNVVQPKVVTVADLTTDLQDSMQNRLIKLVGFEFAAADTTKTYANATTNPPGSVNFVLKNCAGNSITLRNSGFADFAAISVPNGNGSITAIYTVFGSTKQLTIRDTSDVQFAGTRCTTSGGGGGGGTGTALLDETFESATNNADVALTGWKNISETGTWKYQIKTFSNNKYAQMNPFSSSNQQPIVKSWLITPGVSLDATTNEILTFKTLDGFVNGSTLKVYYSTDYSGSATPWTATWTQLTATIATGGPASGYAAAFTNSGDVSLNAISGTVYIAFVYEGAYLNPTQKTTAYEIDNVKITGN
jgi:hypothetical protein